MPDTVPKSPFFYAWARKHAHVPSVIAEAVRNAIQRAQAVLKVDDPSTHNELEKQMVQLVVAHEVQALGSVWSSQNEAVMGLAAVDFTFENQPCRVASVLASSDETGHRVAVDLRLGGTLPLRIPVTIVVDDQGNYAIDWHGDHGEEQTRRATRKLIAMGNEASRFRARRRFIYVQPPEAA